MRLILPSSRLPSTPELYCSSFCCLRPYTDMCYSAPTHTSSQRCQSTQPSQTLSLQRPTPNNNSNSAFHAAMNAYFDDLAAAQQRRASVPPAPHVCQGSCRGPELWLCRRCATPESIDRYLLSRQPAGITPVAQNSLSLAGGPRAISVAKNGEEVEPKAMKRSS